METISQLQVILADYNKKLAALGKDYKKYQNAFSTGYELCELTKATEKELPTKAGDLHQEALTMLKCMEEAFCWDMEEILEGEDKDLYFNGDVYLSDSNTLWEKYKG